MQDINKEIVGLRQEYSQSQLTESDVCKNALDQFNKWLEQALKACVPEPHAMNLSTVSKEGKPSSRIVLLRGVENNGFVFYTNYQSHKGTDLNANRFACLNFFWQALERQVRIEGIIEKNDLKTATEYFHSRPRESQIGAWASTQSKVINSRKDIEDAFQYYQDKFKDTPLIPKPECWGGFVLYPETIEFWQGRPSRLHDRIRYSKLSNNEWKIERLSP